jgi:hypothetical protein
LRTAGHDVQLGGNIGTAILSLAPPALARVHLIEVSSYQIDLAPSLVALSARRDVGLAFVSFAAAIRYAADLRSRRTRSGCHRGLGMPYPVRAGRDDDGACHVG